MVRYLHNDSLHQQFCNGVPANYWGNSVKLFKLCKISNSFVRT